MKNSKAAREHHAQPGELGHALSSGCNFQRVEAIKGPTAEAGALAQINNLNNLVINQTILSQSCVVESREAVQSEMHQERLRLASEVETMQATANAKHEEIVQRVAQVSWDAARQLATAAIDTNEEQCWSAVRQAEAVAEYSQQVAQRASSEAGEQLRFAQAVHTKQQSEVAALMEELRSRNA